MDARLQVWLGFAGHALSFMGEFAVDGVSGEGPRRGLTVTATAADLKGDIRAPRTRGWEGKSLADIVRTIAGEAKLKPVIGDSVAGASWAYLAQTAESNLHFLSRIAATLDATAKPAGGALIVQRRGEGKTAAGAVLVPPVIDTARLTRWSWRLEGREIYGSVEVEWRDTAGGQTNRLIRGSGTPARRIRTVYGSEAEAARAAEAALSGASRAAMSFEAEVAGFEPALLAGASTGLQGASLRPELIGEWHLSEVTHRYDRGGLLTAFRAKKGQPK
jgi:phage protein D